MNNRIFIAVATMGLVLAVARSSAATVTVADTIYSGGDIITVDKQQPAAEALAVKDGKILALGPASEIQLAYRGDSTVIVDLAGKTLSPAFIDPHSHYFSSLTVANQVNVFAPPAGRERIFLPSSVGHGNV